MNVTQEISMSESRPNQAGQSGLAILFIVVLFGALFLGAGGLTWVWIRAARAERAAEAEARYHEQVARDRIEAAARTAEEARLAQQTRRDRSEAASPAADEAPIEENEPAPAASVAAHCVHDGACCFVFSALSQE
jgi:uncharacterized protein HemX